MTWTPPTVEEIAQAIADGIRLRRYIEKQARQVSSEEERLFYMEDAAGSSPAPGTIRDLPPDAQQVLDENLWDLYASEELPKRSG